MVTIDASFISLTVLLPVIKTWFKEKPGEVVALIKPQFEAGRVETARGSGVIRDSNVHRSVLKRILGYSQSAGYQVTGLIKSPLTGPKGNIEFLVHLLLPKTADIDVDGMVDEVVDRIVGTNLPAAENEPELK